MFWGEGFCIPHSKLKDRFIRISSTLFHDKNDQHRYKYLIPGVEKSFFFFFLKGGGGGGGTLIDNMFD